MITSNALNFRAQVQINFSKLSKLTTFTVLLLCASALTASENPRSFPLSLQSDDVLATGNQWLALPNIRASDGALVSFNVLSMRDRGLLEVVGENGGPALQPYLTVDGKPLAIQSLSWDVIEYWIPAARMTTNDLDVTLTYCAPPDSRAAFIRMTLHNRRSAPVPVTLGMKASWGGLNRVTYTPVALRGERTMAVSPWVDSSEVFSFITDDTKFAWSLIYPGANARTDAPPVVLAPTLDAQRTATVESGGTLEAVFVLGVGLEEFSGPHNAKALREELDRNGADAIIARTAAWCRQRTVPPVGPISIC